MRKNVIKKIIITIICFTGVFLFISPFFSKNIYVLLSKTSLYNSYSLQFIQNEDEEKEFVYFENEFVSQPYTSPMESSIELIQLSLSFLVLSFLLNTLRKDR
ncbi:MAG: hypothetical protein RMJ51_00315 [Candidatus Calescibacterium sp.]|nr:hypothetical protein [Candidatus Calescibacterium sp.]MCX7972037.1 hypothetical protein [bacterium]MDW8194679.1 hypothetical protein [Candidatus Calescibacterium sp.]